jgi:uracil-DNA glycosylase family 4
MHSEGARPKPSNPTGPMAPATDDEIREKYLERAIRELNGFSREVQECELCPRGNFTPVLGSGHPQADIFLLKYAPRPAEVEEGVAFYGRSGNAVLKSLRRLDIDPLAIYGTLCVKCPLGDPSLADPGCVARLVDEIAIVRPRIVVVMGEDAVGALNEVALPLGSPLAFATGEVQRLTPTIEAIVTPDIDVSLDEEDAKREFWRAFKVLGDWYADLPPY